MTRSSLRRIARPFIALCVALMSVCFAHVAKAQATKIECIKSHESGQRASMDNDLLTARDEFLSCANQSCPDLIKADCTQLLVGLGRKLPTVVITAVDPTGRAVGATRISVDGTVRPKAMTGRPLPLNPGSHIVRVESDALAGEQTVIAVTGVKGRAVTIQLAPTMSTPTPLPGPDPMYPQQPAAGNSSGVLLPLAYTGFALAGVGVLVGAITGGLSLSQASDLKDQCPNDACAADKQEDIDTMLALGHASTASFIIAGVAAAGGAVAFILGRNRSQEVGARPVIGPGYVGVVGRF